MTQLVNDIDEDVITSTQVIVTVTTVKSSDGGPNIIPDGDTDGDGSSVTDTVAAIVSAILALVFIILVVCIIRIIRKRGREQRGRRFGQPVIHTITSGTFGAHAAAYRHAPVSISQAPISGALSWESISTNLAPTPRSQVLEESLSQTVLPREAT